MCVFVASVTHLASDTVTLALPGTCSTGEVLLCTTLSRPQPPLLVSQTSLWASLSPVSAQMQRTEQNRTAGLVGQRPFKRGKKTESHKSVTAELRPEGT